MRWKTMIEDARQFLKEYYDQQSSRYFDVRFQEVSEQIEQTGRYDLTTEELTYAAKVAWRNSNRCIGRLFWDRLTVVDARDVQSEEDVFSYLFKHIESATNDGSIRSMVTIFPEQGSLYEVRVWNHQLIRYAGYEREDGVIGDPDSVTFTKLCESLGWQGEGSDYDILPLVIQIGNKEPQLKEIPAELVKEVSIEHQHNEAFNALRLRWYAVPIISDMKLTAGGIDFPAAPFNGWYMGTEIGARNLADPFRYNKLPDIADAFRFERNHDSTLWKDRALVELNAAVLQSFKDAGVTIVDHHTAAKQFRHFEQLEEKSGRDVTGDWTWLIPPLSPAATHVFHKPYEDVHRVPNYLYQQAPYKKD
ncbi:nitric oxide synthase oxygenase [Geomicrobium sp. JCM 19038]|uniref:nitric oxide synthase oxygenase n=1 Tax=Geomicrobium sp. JCM 19038 TaxID=1460635 RepID=UPI0005A810D6|nr:nitric oxide synthase oxygenase [Geomicrobium sp. JCM 19038]